MTSTRKHVRFTSIILAAIMLISTLCIAGTASAGAVTDKVSLYSSGVFFSKYGSSNYIVYLKTKDNGSDQKVYVHYNYLDGQAWNDAQAEYVKSLSDGSKIWKASFSSYNCKYAVKFVSGGKTYWDNNGGQNYTRANIIGSAPVAVERQGYGNYHVYNGSFGGYKINAVLQNYAYHKNVFVRYTTDGWNTYRDQSLSYSATNADRTETWSTNVMMTSQVDPKNFQYAVCYRVNGNEYWANNFGANYDGYYYINQ